MIIAIHSLFLLGEFTKATVFSYSGIANSREKCGFVTFFLILPAVY
jgi:hypothetical protein